MSLMKDKQTIFNEVVAHALNQIDRFGDEAQASAEIDHQLV